jgi:hypothetical protein
MIAYNTTGLRNLLIQDQAIEAFENGYLTKEELVNIQTAYPGSFYMPNAFIRIGLFILTYIIMSFTSGIFALMFLSGSDKVIGGLAIFLGSLAYAALEFMVQNKNHFRSGVDDALLLISGGFLFGGISYISNAGAVANCCMIFTIATYLALRFADRLITIVAFVSLLGIFFYSFINSEGMAKAMLPFILMGVSFISYFVSRKLNKVVALQYYVGCLQVLTITSLLSFYCSCNYYVVNELSKSAYNLPENKSVPFGWLFWIFTIIVPLFYLARGIQKKDSILIRTGLILVAGIVFTIRYYYSVAPIEIMMILGGMVLILISYSLIRYLKEPKYGFTYKPNNTADKLQLEALLIAQTFAKQQQADTTTFGGGGFGGGGASGEF